jgi:pimeloyl-ACP methyl ester carboxylesterase
MKFEFLALCVLLSLVFSLQSNAGVYQMFIQKKIEQKKREESQQRFTPSTRVDQGSFDQLLDHFDSTQKTTFKQRYYITLDDTHDNALAPVIYYQCGEGNCLDSGDPIPPAIHTYASELGAAVVILEHRYYGTSQPFNQLTADNLKYLTYEQALEDFVSFQNYVEQNKGLTGKWIFAGGSYSGALSAYYRLKHPDLVVGALSSSGVVKTEVSFEDYDRMVALGLGSDCLAAVQEVTHQIEKVLHDPKALAKIQATFQSQDVKSGLDFLSVVGDMPSGAVQYGEQDAFCQTLLSSSDHLTSFATAGLQIFNDLDIKPLDMTFQGMQSTDVANYEGGAGSRQWAYQSCAQFGGFGVPYHDPSLSAESALLDLQYNLDGCNSLFGISTAPDTDAMNATYYKPLLDPSTTQIFFTNGSQDPYSTLSIAAVNNNVINPNTSAFTLKGYSHCSDLGSSDGGIIDQAQAMFLQLARQWLGMSRNI